MDINVPAIREMLDLIEEKLGDDVCVTIFSDGSGFLLCDGHGSLPKDTIITEFTGLGELAEELV